ncbi:MAG: mRNA surveillance protein pelota [Candidatus Bathyarchaeia archaeon]|nr:mRNA surveillance protein pelota [Candidatus Bathyarchaeota archaeon]
MKILKEDLKHGLIALIVTNLNDLWVLYNIIEENDLIYAKTTREFKSDRVGRPSSRRIPINIQLKVKNVYFDKEMKRLRVHGVITEAPEEFNVKGSHHTLNLTEGSKLSIIKEEWSKYHLERIKKALIEDEPVIIVSLDSDECCIAIVRDYNVSIEAEINSLLSGKLSFNEREEEIKKYFSTIINSLTSSLSKINCKIVIVGPGFTKEEFIKFIKLKKSELINKIVAVKNVGSSGLAGVYEALRVGIIRDVLKKSKIAEEIELVEEFLKMIAVNEDLASFGIDEVEERIIAGAVEKLLICNDKFAKAEERKKLEKLMELAENRGGKVFLIDGTHEGGKKLMAIGGIAAFLRYPKYKA